jgi:hypothetical protein
MHSQPEARHTRPSAGASAARSHTAGESAAPDRNPAFHIDSRSVRAHLCPGQEEATDASMVAAAVMGLGGGTAAPTAPAPATREQTAVASSDAIAGVGHLQSRAEVLLARLGVATMGAGAEDNDDEDAEVGDVDEDEDEEEYTCAPAWRFYSRECALRGMSELRQNIGHGARLLHRAPVDQDE